MKKYNITIEEVEEVEGEKYPKKTEIFTQTISFAEVRLIEIIKAINGLN